MECGGVRPAHLVGHQTLELQEGRYDGHFYKGESSVAVTPGRPRCSPHDCRLLPPGPRPGAYDSIGLPPLLRTSDGVDAGTIWLHQKAAKGCPKHRTPG